MSGTGYILNDVMQIYETVGVYLGYGLAMYALSEPRSQLSL